jgi:hypothetical protein
MISPLFFYYRNTRKLDPRTAFLRIICRLPDKGMNRNKASFAARGSLTSVGICFAGCLQDLF